MSVCAAQKQDAFELIRPLLEQPESVESQNSLGECWIQTAFVADVVQASAKSSAEPKYFNETEQFSHH